ncbi:MAG: CoA pyrophosphatase [Acidimicrobiia bacterium]
MGDVVTAPGSSDTITVADVVDACASLPEPVWRRIVPDHPRPRRAATLVPIVDIDGHAAVVVTKRAGSLDHGGDWVFPGGQVDDDDASHRDAARREAAEELGVDEHHIEVVGQLTTYGPIVSGYVIEVYVGLLDPTARLAPPPGEVAEVAVVRIAHLLDADTHRRAPANIERRARLAEAELLGFTPDLSDLRHYRVRDDEHLWGLQADIIFELLRHLTGGTHDF